MKIPFLGKDKQTQAKKEGFTIYSKTFASPFLKLNFFPFGGYVGDVNKILFGYYSESDTLSGVRVEVDKSSSLFSSVKKEYPVVPNRWYHPEFIFPRGILNGLNIAGSYSTDEVHISPYEKTTIYIVGDELGLPLEDLKYPIRTQEVMQILSENHRLRDENLALKIGRNKLVKERSDLHAAPFSHLLGELEAANEIANAMGKGKRPEYEDWYGRPYGYGGWSPSWRRSYPGAEGYEREGEMAKKTKQDELRERFEEIQKKLRGEIP